MLLIGVVSGRVAAAMDADPAKDITALSKVHLVIRGGSILYKS